MDQDFIWEADYGDREEAIEATKVLLRNNEKTLQCVSFFVNNNPYNLEFYVLVSFDSPDKQNIDEMNTLFNIGGMKIRVDVTINSLMLECGNRRFNTTAFCKESDIDLKCSSLFSIPSKTVLRNNGYIMRPFTKEKEIFISHSSIDKKKIKEVIPYLNGENHAVWFDEYSIDAGDLLYESILDGISNASVVVLWITNSFLESKWCTKELEMARKNNCKIVSCVDELIDKDDLPHDLLQSKYLSIKKTDSIDVISKKILDAVL